MRPRANAEFVWKMEDVLDVYTQPYDEQKPLVCMDETSKQQVMEVREPTGCAPGRERRYDSHYMRNGVSNLFMFFAPLEGWRHVKVTDRRTRLDWAEAMRELVDEHFPQAKRITVVMDNLNTHSPISLYQAFAPQEARRLLDRLEFHYTPKHGSWLNMAEIELSVLSRQCLSRRIRNQETLRSEVAVWEQARNGKSSTVDWRFTTEDARIKLKTLYPAFAA
jgi:transposase